MKQTLLTRKEDFAKGFASHLLIYALVVVPSRRTSA